MSRSPIPLALHGITRRQDDSTVLRDVSLAFGAEGFVMLVGDAGCRALLRVAGLLEAPDEGDVFVHGTGTCNLEEAERTGLRNRNFGFVFSAPYLLPAMTVVENVAVPLFKISESGVEEAQLRSAEVFEFVGMADAGRLNATELSAPEQSRVALARALVHRPSFLMVENADTGLSAEDAARFVLLLREVPKRFGTTVLAVLATPIVAGPDDRILVIQQGEVQSDTRVPAAGAGAAQ
ncbi:MAG: ATP-binding cassette domain-containing protein [Chthoniobacteraceae bacterium]